jgi:PAS domain S-box-containing protein
VTGDPTLSEFASIQRYAERLRLQREIDQAILRAQSVDQTADAVLAGLRQLVSCLRASVMLFDYDADEIVVLATHSDFPLQLQAGRRARLSQAFFLGASRRGEPHIVEDLCDVPDEHPWIAALRSEGVRCYTSLPLTAEGQVIGALTFGLQQPGQPPAEALEIALDSADHLALAIVNVRLREQVLRHAEELETRIAVRTAALRVSEARFRAIFETAPLGMSLADSRGRVLQANPALIKVLGYAEGELQQMALPDFGDSEQVRRYIRKRFDKFVEGQEQFYSMEARLRRKDGSPIAALLTIARMRGASEAAGLAVVMVEDVTAERQARVALVQAEREAIIGRLGASLAHEINNPLQSIIGCLGLVEEILPADGEAAAYLKVARSELNRVARTVARLRDLQRAAQPDQFTQTQINELVAELVTLNEARCSELGIEVIWRPARSLPPVRVMPDRMRQVFLNLILNAVDAMPAGGKLSVSTAATRQPAGVRLTVRDTGEGMPAAVLARLFQPFYTTKKYGLGLGLYTSRSIVEQHGGAIEAHSRPGRGTTFTVWLPVSPLERG